MLTNIVGLMYGSGSFFLHNYLEDLDINLFLWCHFVRQKVVNGVWEISLFQTNRKTAKKNFLKLLFSSGTSMSSQIKERVHQKVTDDGLEEKWSHNKWYRTQESVSGRKFCAFCLCISFPLGESISVLCSLTLRSY